MASLLDSFFVSFGIDSSGILRGIEKIKAAMSEGEKASEKLGKTFEKNRKAEEGGAKSTADAVKKKGKEAESAGKKGADAFSLFRKEALAVFALFAGGRTFTGIAEFASKSSNEMGNLNRQLGISSGRINQIGAALQRVGGKRDDAASWYSSLQMEGASWQGRTKLETVGLKTGIGNIFDQKGNPRADILDRLAVSKQFQSYAPNVRASYLKELGAPPSVANLLNRPDASSVLKQYGGHGVSKADERAADNFNDSKIKWELTTEDFSRKAFTTIEPALARLAKSFENLLKSNPDALSSGLNDLAKALDFFGKVLDSKTLKNLIFWMSKHSHIGAVMDRVGEYGALIEKQQKGEISGGDLLKQGVGMFFSDAKSIGKKTYEWDKELYGSIAKEEIRLAPQMAKEEGSLILQLKDWASGKIGSSIGGNIGASLIQSEEFKTSNQSYDKRLESRISNSETNNNNQNLRNNHFSTTIHVQAPPSANPHDFANKITKELATQWDMASGGGLR